MIKFLKGNILNDNAEALVNTVNTVGVMGRGLALSFKKAFPENFRKYKQVCNEGNLTIGKMFVYETHLLQPKYIINFPTKTHWRYPSKYEYIHRGLIELREWLVERKIASVAIPPLGSGNGKLKWEQVKPVIEKYLSDLEGIDIRVYEPGFISPYDKELTEPSRQHLTKARAMLLSLFKQYEALDFDINLLVGQKLAYFMQRFGEPLRLSYERGWYGPYAHNLNKVLQVLNGKYIFYDASSTQPATPVSRNNQYDEDINRYITDYLSVSQKKRLVRISQFIEGFETPFSLELLGSVDMVLHEHPVWSPEEILADIQEWTYRKKELITLYHVEVVYNHLMRYRSYLYPEFAKDSGV